ncbi:averantin oxidoreductase [Colletotrichum costaricense]|uniref:Averantin oxidoreductase n=1 Tax=Colletotrichum costaricense TaxID=1209916 RepID=A0AAJ0DVW5_9PEZI|nr:averantin oxidoreductase [Colletotrichum costaricense]KAK1516903.1 averantin oxidoreductase [Colletotrichum costaricense]
MTLDTNKILANWSTFSATVLESLAQISPAQMLIATLALIPVYFVVGLLYNAYFHPLAKFPGPLYARCSDIPYMAVHTKGEMLPWLSSLHAKYGDVVRIGASRLSIINGQAWKDIYAHKTGGKKNFPKDPRVYGTDPNGHRNLITTLPDSDHSRLRRVFSPAFSERSLKAQAPLILSYVDQLMGNIRRGIQTDSDAKFDMVKLYNLTTFDIMAELAFGESLGLLADSEYSEWVANIFDNLKNGAFAQVGREWSWLGNIVKLITPPRLKQAADMHFRHSIERVDRRLERNTDKADIWKLVLSQPEGKQIDKFDMYNNASVFMVAGSETTATILSGVTYLLLRNPDKLALLVSEIRGVDSEDDLDIQRLSALPYMTAVLNEALRWYPPVPVGVWREVPEGGSAVAGHWIPEKTRVSVPQFPANHSPRNFKDPEAFIPERWIPGPEYESNTKEVVQPFSIGPRNCIGINLAWHEMRLILAKTLWNFDLSLCQESENWSDQKSYILWEKHPLMVTIKSVR